MADIFGVVADLTRREILGILLARYTQAGTTASAGTAGASGPTDRELSVSDIVGELGLSQPTISKHLKVLREAGLVSVREEGQHRFYHLDYAPLEAIEDWLIPFLSVDFDGSFEDSLGAEAGLKDEQRAFASKLGKAIAETSFQVTHVVKDATPKKWRKSE